MLNRISRVLCYLQEFLRMLFFRPISFFCRSFFPSYRNIWLVSERGNDARDNGYWFYHYLRTEHPEIHSFYVISPDSMDAPKIVALGGLVPFGSFRHYLLYYSAAYLIGTHVQPCSADLLVYYHLASKGVRARGKQIFLQHGIIKDDLLFLHRQNLYLDLFVCGAKPEYDYIRETYGFPPDVPLYVGLARFDNLIRARQCGTQKMILVMPTWRGAHYPSGNAFRETAYYRAFQSLLSSSRLHRLLKEQNYQLIFYPHVEMQNHLHEFQSASDRVILADKSTHDVQKLLMDCALLITDYSSVFFDVAYLEKPELFYQFDEEEFRRYHYQKGYFDYRLDGFGPVCTDEDTLLNELEACFRDRMQLSPEYRERVSRFFPLRDDQNCRRTFEAVCSL